MKPLTKTRIKYAVMYAVLGFMIGCVAELALPGAPLAFILMCGGAFLGVVTNNPPKGEARNG